MKCLVVAAAMLVPGCVTTADCDQYVGCAEDEICFQSRCLPECDTDDDCGDNRWCAPCHSTEGDDRCLGQQGGACIEGDPP